MKRTTSSTTKSETRIFRTRRPATNSLRRNSSKVTDLGYHVVSRYFLRDEVSWQNIGIGRWKELAVAKREILEALGLTKPKEVTTEPKKEFVDVELKEAAHS